MEVTLILKNYKGQVISSAAEAFQGSPSGKFEVPNEKKPFSITFSNDDKVLCSGWLLTGFRITVSGAKSYALRIGQVSSDTIGVSFKFFSLYAFLCLCLKSFAYDIFSHITEVKIA
jgi:hypothetical protein